MRNPRGISMLPPALVAIVLVSLTRATTIDFSFYPPNAQTCLYQASNSSNCAAGTVAATNACLCNNGGNFVTNTASCLGKSDEADISGVYGVLKSACSDSSTPLNVGEEQYLSAAGVSGTLTAVQPSATSTPVSTADSTVVTSTSTKPPATTSTNGGELPAVTDDGRKESAPSKGLSVGAKAGIIAGAVVVGLTSLGVAAFMFIRYKKRKDGEESHPMLPQETRHMSLIPTPAETVALEGVVEGPDWPKDAKWRPVSTVVEQRKSIFNWESPYHLAYPGDDVVEQGPSPSPSPPPASALAPAPALVPTPTPAAPAAALVPAPSPTPSPRPRESQSRISLTPSRLFELQGSDRQPAEIGTEIPVELGDPPSPEAPPIHEPTAAQLYGGSGWTEIDPGDSPRGLRPAPRR